VDRAKINRAIGVCIVTDTPENNRAIIDWTRGSRTPASMDTNGDDVRQLSLATLHGAVWLVPGDIALKIASDVFDVEKAEATNG
jgi:hypothetical protein